MLYVIRIILFSFWVAFSTFLGTILCLFRPMNPKNLTFTCKLIQFSRFFMGIRLIKRNAHYLKENHPCVVISNHQHNFDIIPGTYTLEERTVTIGKKSILYIPIFGIFYWLSGNILIDRKNKKSAFGTMDAAAMAIKNENKSIWIMPEGTRSRGRGLLPFKKGPFVTAKKADVVIIPIAWSNYVNHLNLNKWHAGTIISEVLPPMETKNLTAEELRDKAYLIIKEALARIDQEVAEMDRE